MLVAQICVAAEKEYSLEKALAAMKSEWASLQFELRPYKESGTYVVSGVDDIVMMLDDHLIKTQTMRGSPYIQPVEAECKVQDSTLSMGSPRVNGCTVEPEHWKH